MKHYNVVSVEHSIVNPEFVDVELSHDGHLVSVVRMPRRLEDALRKNSGVAVFEMIDQTPVAYQVGNDFHFAIQPGRTMASEYVWRGIPGLMQGSLDTMRFNLAVARALRAGGTWPTLNPLRNMEKLAQRVR